ncbi:MAG: FecR family protein [Thermoleophilia bacterium]
MLQLCHTPAIRARLALLFVLLVAGAIGLPASASAAGALQLVSVTARNDASVCVPTMTFTVPDPGGTASFVAPYGSATFSFPVPATIPAEGTTFPLTITGQGTNFAPALGVSGSIVSGGSVSVGTWWRADESGNPTGGSVSETVTLKPNGSATATLTVGVSYCTEFTYSYEEVRCGRTVNRKPQAGRAINEIRLVAVQQEVLVHRAGCDEELWLPATRDMVLQQGDEISCDPDGAATIQFADNSTVVVRHTTQLKIASFFTEGGVVKTEILLKMGEVAATVHKSEATRSDFRIKSPSGAVSVRGTAFTTFYDPGSKAMLVTTTEGEVEVDPDGDGLGTVGVPAGSEVEVLPASMSQVVKAGTAGARGGSTRAAALRRVAAIIARNNAACGVTTPFGAATSVKPAKGGWAVGVRVTGKRKGLSTWTVVRGKATPINALARTLAKGCAVRR